MVAMTVKSTVLFENNRLLASIICSDGRGPTMGRSGWKLAVPAAVPDYP